MHKQEINFFLSFNFELEPMGITLIYLWRCKCKRTKDVTLQPLL